MNAVDVVDVGGRQINLLITIGSPKIPLAFEGVTTFNFSEVEDINQEKLDYLRADLVIYNNIINTSDALVAAKRLVGHVHEAGMIYLVNTRTKLADILPSLGFVETAKSGLYKRSAAISPKDYNKNYLDRWGKTDFMKNWRLSSKQILEHLPRGSNRETARILDVGCLNGYIMESLRRSGAINVYGTDISYEISVNSVVESALLPRITVGDFVNNIYPDGFSDMTICMEVLEHIQPDLTNCFIQELRRVTSSRGVLLVSTSDDWTIDPTHVNCRPRLEWFEIFAQHGFIPTGRQVIFPGFNSFVLKKAANENQRRVFYGVFNSLRRFCNLLYKTHSFHSLIPRVVTDR